MRYRDRLVTLCVNFGANIGAACLALMTQLPAKPAVAAYSNYNSVLLGSRAAGMGGAFTSLSGDPSSMAFYNPATGVLMPGNHLSASASVYNKFETTLGASQDFNEAPQRLNRGFFRSLPAASGTILSFKSFTVGISILVPDYDFFSGQVKGSAEAVSFLNNLDESLWAGGSFSGKLTENDSVGISIYYTARNLSRTVNDRQIKAGGAGAILTSEEKNLTANSIVSIFGFHRRLTPTWSFGASYRPPSLPIAGDATYYRATTDTAPFATTVINQGNLRAITKIPAKFALGVAREVPGRNTISLDLSFYEGLAYDDLPEFQNGADRIEHRPVMNFAVGYEQVIQPWLRARAGIFSNFSSHPAPDISRGSRQGDQVDMNGFSANIAFNTSHGTNFTFGGYYSAGRGQTTQRVGGSYDLVTKNQQVFTMLVATGFVF